MTAQAKFKRMRRRARTQARKDMWAGRDTKVMSVTVGGRKVLLIDGYVFTDAFRDLAFWLDAAAKDRKAGEYNDARQSLRFARDQAERLAAKLP